MIETDRLVAAAPSTPQEEAFERALRPKALEEYIGQETIRGQLQIFIEAARRRAESLDHVLLFGPPGLGKTTLAHIIAREMGVNLRHTSGPVLERAGDLAAILTNLEPKDVLFIDEIHRLSPVVEEILYPALEDFQIDIMIGEGPAARSVKLDLPPFTLVGATTRAGMLTNPLRDRFGIVARLEFYTPEELTRIVERSARLLNVGIEPAGAFEIAGRSRGTPRISNRLLRRVRDYAEVKAQGRVTRDVADAALEMLDVDPAGLDVMDRKLLRAVIDKFGGGPVGVDNIAAAISEERDTIEDVLEPYLIQQGYLQRTPRGRVATVAAYRHFGLAQPGRAGSPSSGTMPADTSRRGPALAFGSGLAVPRTEGNLPRFPSIASLLPPNNGRTEKSDRPPVKSISGATPAVAPQSQPFSWPLRVYYEDTDAAGIVYYANYLKFTERARTEWLRALGFEQTDLAREHGVAFVVRSAAIDFVKPARFNDTLQVTVELIKVGAGQIDVVQRVLRTDELLAAVTVNVACVRLATMRAARIPQPLATRIRMGV